MAGAHRGAIHALSTAKVDTVWVLAYTLSTYMSTLRSFTKWQG